MAKKEYIKEMVLEKCKYCGRPYERADYVWYYDVCLNKLKQQKEEGTVLIYGDNVKLQLFDFSQKGFIVTHMACTGSYVYMLMERPKQTHDTHVIEDKT